MRGYRGPQVAVLLVSLIVSNHLSPSWGAKLEGIHSLASPGPGFGMEPTTSNGDYNYYNMQRQYGPSYDQPDQYHQYSQPHHNDAQYYGQPHGGHQSGMDPNPGANPHFFPPYGYKDYGYNVQVGPEGYLVPNSWYGIIPWGVDGMTIVITGVIVIVIIALLVVGLIVWLTHFQILGLAKEARSLTMAHQSDLNLFSLAKVNAVTDQVMDALDKYRGLDG